MPEFTSEQVISAAIVVAVTLLAAVISSIVATARGTNLARQILVASAAHQGKEWRNVTLVLAHLPVSAVLSMKVNDRADGAYDLEWPLSPRRVVLEVTHSCWSLDEFIDGRISQIRGGTLTDHRKVAKKTARAIRRHHRKAVR